MGNQLLVMTLPTGSPWQPIAQIKVWSLVEDFHWVSQVDEGIHGK